MRLPPSSKAMDPAEISTEHEACCQILRLPKLKRPDVGQVDCRAALAQGEARVQH